MKKEYYLIIDGEKIVVTEEVYHAYRQPQWREKKRKQNVWRCRDGKGVRCKGDCSRCDISRFGTGASGSDISLERFIDEDGGDVRSETDIEATVIRNGQLKELAKAIEMLDKDEQKVLTLIASGRKKKDCAEELGISPRMFRHREERIYEKLRANLKKNGWI